MWALLTKLLPGAFGAFERWRGDRAVISKIKANTDSQLALSQHELNVIRTKLTAGSWSDEILLAWLIMIFSLPFAPSVYTLIGGDVAVAEQSARLAKEAVNYVFGTSSGPIMAAVVASVFGFSRIGRKL